MSDAPSIAIDLSEFTQLSAAEVMWRSLDAHSPNLPCDTFECEHRHWCVARRVCKREAG